MSSAELACGYAALLLHGDGIPITAEKIATVVKAANVQVDSYWPSLFAKLLEKWSVDDLILNFGSGGGGAAPVAMSAAPAAGGAATAAAPAVEEKKDKVMLATWRWLIGGIDKFVEVRRGWIQPEGWVRNDLILDARVPQK